MRLTLFRIFHYAIVAYALFMLWLPLRILAQVRPLATTVQQFQIGDLERRVENLEALKLDSRLSVIESKLGENTSVSYSGAVGVALLLLERAVGALRSKKRSAVE